MSHQRTERPPADLVALRRPRVAARFGEYDVVAPIARGGMGGVYEAVHAPTGERVALKVLDARFAANEALVAQLHGERALASRTRHPGVLEIRAAAFAPDGVPYLVMEHVAGETVGALVDRDAVDLDLAIAIGARVSAALAALHDAGVVHCDVKHDNIILASGPDVRTKLIDFGVSRLATDPPREDAAIAGTPWCMAPEQWRGHPAPASDVYALGCVLYDLTTGNPPFDGSLPALMAAHLDQRPARPSWLAPMPSALERVVLHALAKDPGDRPSMLDVAHALADASDLSALRHSAVAAA